MMYWGETTVYMTIYKAVTPFQCSSPLCKEHAHIAETELTSACDKHVTFSAVDTPTETFFDPKLQLTRSRNQSPFNYHIEQQIVGFH